MAKKQSFGDKVRKRRQAIRVMARVMVAEKKPTGSIVTAKRWCRSATSTRS